jgi:hypothetical protein
VVPELPDVEVARRRLDHALCGATHTFQSLVLLFYRAFGIDEHDPGDAVDDSPTSAALRPPG